MNVPVLTVVFNVPLFPRQIKKYFHAEICNLVKLHKPEFDARKLPTSLFHNHDEKTKKNDHGYPLVQYKVIEKRAAITGIGKGAEALMLLLEILSRGSVSIVIENGPPRTLFIYDIIKQKEEHQLKMLPTQKEYRTYHLLGLNSKNYKAWENTHRLADKLVFLEKSLTDNIRRFASSVGYFDTANLKAFVTGISETRFEPDGHNQRSFLSIDCTFSANIDLPEEIGLGHSVSLGFGKVLLKPDKKQNKAVLIKKRQVVADL